MLAGHRNDAGERLGGQVYVARSGVAMGSLSRLPKGWLGGEH